MKLGYDFYKNHVADVARRLLGKRLVYGSHWGIITETEAYRGADDPASHACRGPTKRSAVLIRGLMISNSTHLNGPGKICRFLQITKEQNGVNLIENENFYVGEGISVKDIVVTPRIGIRQAVDIPWRFCLGEIKS